MYGHGGPFYESTLFYCVVRFGDAVAVAWFWGVVLQKPMQGRRLGGATLLGYGVGNGWGIWEKRN